MDEGASKANAFEETSKSFLDLGAEKNAGQEIENGNEKEADEEEHNDGEEEEEEDDDNEEADYAFQFERGMNPLDFTEDDAFGVQPYQRFERLEYEALAEKKRKALANSLRENSTKKARVNDDSEVNIDELMESMNYGGRRKYRKLKKKGRRKGSKNQLSPEITRKLGDATLHYAHGSYDEAIAVLKEVILVAPTLPDPYHTLGLVYKAMGDDKKALNFYMLAAHMSPKDPSLWKFLVTWSVEQGNTGQARYCLSKAISADPEDISLKFHYASLQLELGNYQNAAEAYLKISRLSPENVEAIRTAAKLFLSCDQVERSISILEDYLKAQPKRADSSVLDLLVVICMGNNMHHKALQYMEHAHAGCSPSKELPFYWAIKAGICHAHIGNLEKAEVYFSAIREDNAHDHTDLIMEVADACVGLGIHDDALKYYLMLNGGCGDNNGSLNLKIARCYLSLKERTQAISFFYKALNEREDDIDTRLTLSCLLLEEAKTDEAISLLSPPKDLAPTSESDSSETRPWWHHGEIRLKLSDIYRANGMLENFVDTVSSLVRESLFIETLQQKVRARKRLSTSELFERVKVSGEGQNGNLFCGFRPIASASDLVKAARAKKSLEKKALLKEKRKVATLAAGVDWQSDESEDEQPQPTPLESPLPNFLREEKHHSLIIDLCREMASLQRYWEALDIINLTLRLGGNLPSSQKEEFRSLGAQIAYNIADPKHGFDCVKYIVQQHPHSIAAWNCYYRVISRLENRYSKHYKFLHHMRINLKDCVPPMIIVGNQLTMISQHQAAAREYLEAYRLMPDEPLINICAGTALINLALGFRLQNKHQALTQGLGFLYNNLRICGNSQEAYYNIARAFHHIGLVSLAVSYYEKVVAMAQKDLPVPRLPYETPDKESLKPGYCNLRREAAYNLHLIYKRSGAVDLARQVLKDFLTL